MINPKSKNWFIIELIFLIILLVIVTLITKIYFIGLSRSTLSENLIYSSISGLVIELTFALILIGWIIFFHKKLGITRNNLGYKKIKNPISTIWFYYLLIIVFIIGIIGFIGLLISGIIIIHVEISVLILSFLYACACAPMVEEFIFRGFLYKRATDIFKNKKWEFNWNFLEIFPFSLFRKYELYYATFFTSTLFGFFHLIGGLNLDNLFQVIYTFIGGLFFCMFKNQTKSIFTSILFHSAWNGAMGLIGIAAISLGFIDTNIFTFYII